MTLTGRRRFRVEIVRRTFGTDQLLVLQVEVLQQPLDDHQEGTRWRDATLEDLTTEEVRAGSGMTL